MSTTVNFRTLPKISAEQRQAILNGLFDQFGVGSAGVVTTDDYGFGQGSYGIVLSEQQDPLKIMEWIAGQAGVAIGSVHGTAGEEMVIFSFPTNANTGPFDPRVHAFARREDAENICVAHLASLEQRARELSSGRKLLGIEVIHQSEIGSPWSKAHEFPWFLVAKYERRDHSS